MERFFNTAGPINKEDHYCIDPLNRIDLTEILALINQKKYFVLHAPRQTGKTSYLLSLMEHLNKEDKYNALYTNIENAQAARENVEKGIRAILDSLAEAAKYYLDDPFIEDNLKQILERKNEFSALNQTLSEWCRNSDKPVVLFLDEVDSLVGDTLISLLRQLRSGYTNRPSAFPQSVILCGVRDVRDCRIHSDIDKTLITGGSAFNIKAESLSLEKFNSREVEKLYKQHTTETGQAFHKEIFPLVWELTEGQPWLVNALAYEVCFKMKEGRGREKSITIPMIEKARENLILRRETHLNQLSDKLAEARVRRVLLPILAGSQLKRISEDDIDYVSDLGLITQRPQLRIANRIYKEVIPRQLTYSEQLTIYQEAAWYIKEDGSLDVEKLLTAFQDFFRKHIEHWEAGLDYAEAGPQLLLQAFLQRIVNGGGRVEREYGLGRGRTDLLVIWPCKDGVQETVMELKIRYGSRETTIKEGLEQIHGYMDKCGAHEGHLLIFDRSPKAAWEDKIFKKVEPYKNNTIFIYGM